MADARRKMMSELDFAKAQLAFFFVVVLLAIDAMNPVKVVLHVFPSISPWHLAALASACWLYTLVCNLRPVLYFATKVFFESILSIFFNDVQVVGMENVPINGPVIFTSNHANQFIDGLMIMCTCRRTISYLVAEKSWKRPIIGHLAWMMGGVPVRRAQDSAMAGTGTIVVESSGPQPPSLALSAGEGEEPAAPSDDGGAGEETEGQGGGLLRVAGRGTKFLSEVKVGDKIRPAGALAGVKVERIEDDGVLWVKGGGGDATTTSDGGDGDGGGASFDVIPRIDQEEVYRSVLEKLASGGTIGIFPEGGSHDRTDLLPLKVGVSLIAHMSLDRGDGDPPVPIVPVGLNYFRAHRFRGRATVEFGSPTRADPDGLDDFRKGGTDRRRTCNELLERIEDSMRSVIVSVPDYETLQIIHAARRLYRRDGTIQTAQERQDMGRRFAEGYKRLYLAADGDPPRGWSDMQRRLLDYQKELNSLGIKDYQVPGLDRGGGPEGSDAEGQSGADAVLTRMNVLGHIVHLACVSTLAALPALFLNLPVGLAARYWSDRRRITALAASKVKVKGYDVVLSERVLACIILVPSVWIAYGALMLAFTNLDGPALAIIFACFPCFSYWSIRAAESGMVDVKDLRPYVMRIMPSARRRLAALPATRRALRKDLRAFIEELGPTLGDIYYEKDLDWQKIQMERREAETNSPPPPATAVEDRSSSGGGGDGDDGKKEQ